MNLSLKEFMWESLRDLQNSCWKEYAIVLGGETGKLMLAVVDR